MPMKNTEITRLAWITDPHFDRMIRRDAFAARVGELAVDAIVMTGDISDGENLQRDLEIFSEKSDTQAFFVLGNHDHYFSSIKDTQTIARQISTTHEKLHYLDGAESAIQLNNSWYLAGVDSWADAGYGNPETSYVYMNDWQYIEDLKELNREFRNHTLARLALSAALRLRHQISSVPTDKHLIIASHVPPYEEMLGEDSEYAPWYGSRILGAIIDECVQKRTAKTVVLTGHTHRERTYKRRRGIECFVGRPSADIFPAKFVIAGIIEFKENGDYRLEK